MPINLEFLVKVQVNPTRVLVIICAMRGFPTFGTSYGIQPFIERDGFDGRFTIHTILDIVLAVMGVPVLIWGNRLRDLTRRWL